MPVHWVMLSLRCRLGLPLPRLPSTMPSSRSLCRESCLMICKKWHFFFFTVSNSDLLVPAIRITSSFVMLVQLIRSMRLRVHILNASRRCCDILLMVLDSIQQCWSDIAFDESCSYWDLRIRHYRLHFSQWLSRDLLFFSESPLHSFHFG